MNPGRLTTSREPFVRACACGAAVKYTTLNTKEYNMIEAWWEHAHVGPEHEDVPCAEANRVRLDVRKRQGTRS